MPGKKKKKVPLQAIKISLVVLLAGAVGFGMYTLISSLLLKSSVFQISIVKIDPTLSLITRYDTDKLMGKSIFTVDLKEFQKKLSQKYPQISDLRVTKQYPNRIDIQAKKRHPFAQIVLGSTTLTLDEMGVVLSTSSKREDRIPLILGGRESIDRVRLGLPVYEKETKVALSILKAFKEEIENSRMKITDINVKNVSKIRCRLSNEVEVIVDNNDIQKKMKILNVVINEGKLNPSEIKYIDLRFKNPTVGRK